MSRILKNRKSQKDKVIFLSTIYPRFEIDDLLEVIKTLYSRSLTPVNLLLTWKWATTKEC